MVCGEMRCRSGGRLNDEVLWWCLVSRWVDKIVEWSVVGWLLFGYYGGGCLAGCW